jgi:hypothetical protein
MSTKLTWKKGFLSSCYTIYSHGQIIGNLKNRSFSYTADANLNGGKYTFQSKGVFKQETLVLDKENKEIAQITYNNWMTKATIKSNNKVYYLKFDNMLNTKWRIFNAEGIEIKYSSSSTNGYIDSSTDDAALLLSGIFVSNYYIQTSVAVLIAVFVPIFMTLSH